MMDSQSMGISTNLLKLKNPLDSEHKFYMIIETSGSNQKHDEEKLNDFVEKAMSNNFVDDGTLSGDPAKIQVGLFSLLFFLHSPFLHQFLFF